MDPTPSLRDFSMVIACTEKSICCFVTIVMNFGCSLHDDALEIHLGLVVLIPHRNVVYGKVCLRSASSGFDVFFARTSAGTPS